MIEPGLLSVAYAEDEPVGFIGKHPAGSMGMLYILPEHRRKGYAASLALQQRPGLTRSESLVYRLWRPRHEQPDHP